MNKAASCSFVKHKVFFFKFMFLKIYIHTKLTSMSVPSFCNKSHYYVIL